MIKSSKNGRMILLKSRLNISLLISLLICIFFAFIEFVTKYIIFDLGNLNAGVESLMIERTMHLPYIISERGLFVNTVIRSLFGDVNVMWMTLTESCCGDLNEFAIIFKVLDGRAATVTHNGTATAD